MSSIGSVQDSRLSLRESSVAVRSANESYRPAERSNDRGDSTTYRSFAERKATMLLSAIAVLALISTPLFAQCEEESCCLENAVNSIACSLNQETNVEQETSHNSGLSAAQVWKPEIEELEWSDVQPASLHKPWLDKDYLAWNKLAENQVVAYGVAETEPAIHVAAAKHILPRLEMRLEAPWKRHFAMRTILRSLENDLERGNEQLVVDHASQTFFRSIGDEQMAAFTREAVLLDVSEDNLHDLRHDIRRSIRRNERVIQRTFTLAGIAIAVAIVVCWMGSRFFDRVTQGYYVWPIRFATAAVFVAAIGVTGMLTLSILQSLQ